MIWGLLTYLLIVPLICTPFLLGRHLAETVSQSEYLIASLGAVLPENLSYLAVFMLFVSIMSTIDTAAFACAMSITNDFALKLGWIEEKRLEAWTK